MNPISIYKPSPSLLDKQIILVTGAGDGSGRHAAKTYASLGATVLLMGRTVGKLETVGQRYYCSETYASQQLG